MRRGEAPITIKRYAERRLYNCDVGRYVSLDDIAAMVEDEETFVVYDAKSGENLTESLLQQIIRERPPHG